MNVELVCFRGQNGHRADVAVCLLMTQSGHVDGGDHGKRNLSENLQITCGNDATLVSLPDLLG